METRAQEARKRPFLEIGGDLLGRERTGGRDGVERDESVRGQEVDSGETL